MPEKDHSGAPEILLVEDESGVAELVLFYLSQLNLPSLPAFSMGEARALTKDHDFQVAIVDLQLPDGDGLVLIRELKELPNPPFVIATSAAGESLKEGSITSAGADRFLPKPFGLSDLRTSLEEFRSLATAKEDLESVQASKKPDTPALEFYLSAGETALLQKDTREFIRTAHHMANESFALQINPATIEFANAEDAARTDNWVEAKKSWIKACRLFDPYSSREF